MSKAVQPQQAFLEPDPDAQELGRALTDAREVQQQILLETIESAEMGQPMESGRTACGNTEDVRAPIARFPEAVRLSECPIGSVGVWHTHPTMKGLRNPEHSLPDWANIMFEDIDASMVVGTETSELIIAPTDRSEMARRYQNVLGLQVESTRDVVEAIQAGMIPDPESTRERVRQELQPLWRNVPTSHPGLHSRVMDLAETIAPRAPTTYRDCDCSYCAAHHVHRHSKSEVLHERAKACKPMLRQTTAGISVRQIAVATIIGNIVGQVTDRVLFGE